MCSCVFRRASSNQFAAGRFEKVQKSLQVDQYPSVLQADGARARPAMRRLVRHLVAILVLNSIVCQILFVCCLVSSHMHHCGRENFEVDF